VEPGADTAIQPLNQRLSREFGSLASFEGNIEPLIALRR
jgi:hypothetical protein